MVEPQLLVEDCAICADCPERGASTPLLLDRLHRQLRDALSKDDAMEQATAIQSPHDGAQPTVDDGGCKIAARSRDLAGGLVSGPGYQIADPDAVGQPRIVRLEAREHEARVLTGELPVDHGPRFEALLERREAYLEHGRGLLSFLALPESAET